MKSIGFDRFDKSIGMYARDEDRSCRDRDLSMRQISSEFFFRRLQSNLSLISLIALNLRVKFI